MKKIRLTACILALVFLFTGCMASDATSTFDPENVRFLQYEEILPNDEVAVVTTSVGTVRFRLFPDEAPKTVAHFKKLVEEGFYDGLPIFAQEENVTIITGATDETGGAGKIATDDGKALQPEVTANLWHFSGAVSVFGYQENRFSGTYLADSSFFILGNVESTLDMAKEMTECGFPEEVVEKYKEHGGFPQFTGAYTIFGHVYDGMEVVDELTKMQTTGDWSMLKDVKIEKIEISTYKAEEAKNAAEGTDE